MRISVCRRLNEISGEMGPILLDNATHHRESHYQRELSATPPISTPNKSPLNQVNNFLDKFLCLVHFNVCLCLCMQHVYIRYPCQSPVFKVLSNMRSCASKRDSWIVAHSCDQKDDKRTIQIYTWMWKWIYIFIDDEVTDYMGLRATLWDHVDRQLWIYKDIWNEAGSVASD